MVNPIKINVEIDKLPANSNMSISMRNELTAKIGGEILSKGTTSSNYVPAPPPMLSSTTSTLEGQLSESAHKMLTSLLEMLEADDLPIEEQIYRGDWKNLSDQVDNLVEEDWILDNHEPIEETITKKHQESTLQPQGPITKNAERPSILRSLSFNVKPIEKQLRHVMRAHSLDSGLHALKESSKINQELLDCLKKLNATTQEINIGNDWFSTEFSELMKLKDNIKTLKDQHRDIKIEYGYKAQEVEKETTQLSDKLSKKSAYDEANKVRNEGYKRVHVILNACKPILNEIENNINLATNVYNDKLSAIYSQTFVNKEENKNLSALQTAILKTTMANMLILNAKIRSINKEMGSGGMSLEKNDAIIKFEDYMQLILLVGFAKNTKHVVQQLLKTNVVQGDKILKKGVRDNDSLAKLEFYTSCLGILGYITSSSTDSKKKKLSKILFGVESEKINIFNDNEIEKINKIIKGRQARYKSFVNEK